CTKNTTQKGTAAVFPCQTSKAYDLGQLQCLALLLALMSLRFPSMLTSVSLSSSFCNSMHLRDLHARLILCISSIFSP
ncbi:hypothetical protein L9F63_000072, partial [Diploptera punctata]